MAHLRQIIGVVVCFLAFYHSPAISAEINSFEVDDELSAILITGEILQGDADSFRKEASLHDTAVVILESNGGSTVEAIEIGEAIRLRGFSTLVANGSDCVSACALIWLGGSPRALSKSASVGFHATYVDESGKKMESGVGNALVGRYFTLLNLPMKAVVFATSASPDSLSWLDKSNYQSLGIDASIVDDFDFSAADGKKRTVEISPPPIATVPSQTSETSVWEEVDPWVVMIDHTLGDACFVLRYFSDGTVFRLGYSGPQSSTAGYAMLGNLAWTSLSSGGSQKLIYQFDNNPEWDAPSTVIDLGTLPMLRVPFSDADFWKEFRTSASLQISREDRPVTLLSLVGASGAFNSLQRCQIAATKRLKARDPFAD